uniref:Rab-GAP TBC domain-containing protein n=1 Tax=Neospora caninum (strain Liverpool) TaxID=572307 RepID=A0A0F7U7N4_NEOCL|nr:TPA: hypothetical protein BN1204_009350 [Neospora caninum Liverpool]
MLVRRECSSQAETHCRLSSFSSRCLLSSDSRISSSPPSRAPGGRGRLRGACAEKETVEGKDALETRSLAASLATETEDGETSQGPSGEDEDAEEREDEEVPETFRPRHLPPKSPEEVKRHLQLVQEVERRFFSTVLQEAHDEALRKRVAYVRDFRLSRLTSIWQEELLPSWAPGTPPSDRVKAFWRQGVPPKIREILWPRAIGNALRVTRDLFQINLEKARRCRRQAEAKRESEHTRCWQASSSSLSSPASSSSSSSSSSSASSSESCITVVGGKAAEAVATGGAARGTKATEKAGGLQGAKKPGGWEADDRSPRRDSSADEGEETPGKQSAEERPEGEECSPQSCGRGPMTEDLDVERLSRESSYEAIVFDLTRTFPTLAFFNVNGPLYGDCQNILEAWAFYRPDVGYVQGMSYLAAMLLIYLDPFPAFVCLCNLLNTPTLLGMYRMQTETVHKRYKIFDQLLMENCPELALHLEAVGVPPELYLLEWFLTLFTKALGIDVASFVWDCFFLEGEVVLYVVSVALMALLEKDLLACTDVAEASILLAGISRRMRHGEALLVEKMKRVRVSCRVRMQILQLDREFSVLPQ